MDMKQNSESLKKIKRYRKNMLVRLYNKVKPENHDMFNRMYGSIDTIDDSKIDWAIVQLENQIKKNKLKEDVGVIIDDSVHIDETLEVHEFIEHINWLIEDNGNSILSKIVKYDFSPISKLYKLRSWRGKYSDLTLDYYNDSFINSKDITLLDLYNDLKGCTNGTPFVSYKGGLYYMNTDTPVWADQYGRYNSRMIIGLENTKDCIIIKTKLKVD